MKRPIALLALLIVASLAGCLGGGPQGHDVDLPERPTWEQELDGVAWDTSGPFSRVLERGPFDVLDVERVHFPAHDGIQLAAAVWRPDVPAGTQVPVILMISPYFSAGLFSRDARTQAFFLESFVPHGYAFAKVAVRGSSFSEGCMESMGPNEQRDMDAIVTHFGTQPWSNGNVGIIGLSYVGTTPWAAAQWGNPHLKTIVPMSGVTSWFELGFRNGTAEPRSPVHMALYWGIYGVPDPILTQEAARVLQNVCEEPVWSILAGPPAAATGEPGPARLAEYWDVRDYRQRVAANYEGSIFLVHGLRDWNVNIDMAVPFVTELQAAGIEVQWLLGQWQHSWPDQGSRGVHVRWDFAQMLLRWFDVHLKGQDLDTGPAVHVEDSHGQWRTEATWPPEDVAWRTLHLGDGILSWEATTTGQAVAVNPGGAVDPIECGKTVPASLPPSVDGTEWRFTMGPLPQDFRIAGPVQLHATVTPLDAAGGQMYAELWEVSDAGWYRAGHAAMNLRFHAGGHAPQPITPGQPVKALMEFYAMDVLLKAGNQVVLRVVPDTPIDPCVAARGTGEDTIQRPFLPGPSLLPLTLHWGQGASVLNLPLIERDVGDGRYVGQPG